MTLKNNRAPLLCYFKLCASFHSHLWIQSGVTVRNPLILVKMDDFFSCATLKFDRWPTSSFVHHCITIGKFKLELQSGNAQIGSKSAIFCPVWPWNLMDDLEKNNRAPFLCYFKLCVSFRSHMWNQTGVAVQTRLNWAWPLWPWPLTSDLDLLHGHHFLSMVITPENFMIIQWRKHS